MFRYITVIAIFSIILTIKSQEDDDYADYYDDAPPSDDEIKDESQALDDQKLNLGDLSKNIDQSSNDYESHDMSSHDHGSMDHGSMGGMNHGGHSMAMAFHNNLGMDYLFPGYKVETNKHLFIYSIITILLGIMVEYIKSYRIKKLVNKKNDTYKQKCDKHIKQSILHFIQHSIGYLLMLVAMTFNAYLFLAVMVGFTIGYFLFSGPNKEDEDCCCEASESTAVNEERQSIKKAVGSMDCC